MRATSTTSTTDTATPRTRGTGTSTEPTGRGRAHPTPAPADNSGGGLHAAVAAALARHGVRYTAMRRTLVTALSEAGQPLTIPELVSAAAGVPQSSVYRNLAIFDEAGIVHRMPGTGDFARYELAEHLMGHHHHMVCSTCGAVEDIVLPEAIEEELERALRRIAHQRGFALTSHRLDLVGGCTNCDERSA